MKASVPSVNRPQAQIWIDVGQWPYHAKEYSSETNVLLTMSCPHRLKLGHWVARLQKTVASQAKPKPAIKQSHAKRDASSRASASSTFTPEAQTSYISNVPKPVATPSQ